MPLKRPEKTPMPIREAQVRAHDFVEVNAGYTLFHAAFEAERCLRCQDPVCVAGCPVGIPIPDFIHAVAVGDMPGAAKILRTANPLPVRSRPRRSAGADSSTQSRQCPSRNARKTRGGSDRNSRGGRTWREEDSEDAEDWEDWEDGEDGEDAEDGGDGGDGGDGVTGA